MTTASGVKSAAGSPVCWPSCLGCPNTIVVSFVDSVGGQDSGLSPALSLSACWRDGFSGAGSHLAYTLIDKGTPTGKADGRIPRQRLRV